MPVINWLRLFLSMNPLTYAPYMAIFLASTDFMEMIVLSSFQNTFMKHFICCYYFVFYLVFIIRLIVSVIRYAQIVPSCYNLKHLFSYILWKLISYRLFSLEHWIFQEKCLNFLELLLIHTWKWNFTLKFVDESDSKSKHLNVSSEMIAIGQMMGNHVIFERSIQIDHRKIRNQIRPSNFCVALLFVNWFGISVTLKPFFTICFTQHVR